MISRLNSLALALAVAALSACASSGAPAVASSGGRFVITEAELQAAKERTLLEAIERMRPTYLRSRQVRSSTTPNPEPVHVYVNGQRTEGIDVLRLFTPQHVKEVRFYEPNEANVRFGTGHHGGLIAVTVVQ